VFGRRRPERRRIRRHLRQAGHNKAGCKAKSAKEFHGLNIGINHPIVGEYMPPGSTATEFISAERMKPR
jgi:hypothetical protein